MPEYGILFAYPAFFSKNQVKYPGKKISSFVDKLIFTANLYRSYR